MAAFKPAYLIHGEDHGRISERRARLRRLAEAESGAQGIELFEGEAATPEAVAASLNAMTFALGRRFIVVDGVERWKERDLEPLEVAMAAMPPDTTVAFFAREDGRVKAPARLHDAVQKAGGDIAAEATVKPWELPRWVITQARERGLQLDSDAARTLVAHVGERQQRLVRELEKLVLAHGRGTQILASEVEAETAPSAERRAWSLADALVGDDASAALAMYLALRAQGERLSGLIYSMAQRVRAAIEAAERLEAGESAAQVKRGLRMPSKAADRLIADARRSGSHRLRETLEQIADLEHDSRGGGPGGLSEDTAALLTLSQIAG